MARRIVDCFIFYNELDMLECRLRELWDVVDVFVLAEGSTTYSGDPKPKYFADLAADVSGRFAPYMSKIVPVLALLADVDRWQREQVLRNSLAEPLPDLNLADDDIVVLSDVDEIPDARTLARFRDHRMGNLVALEQDFYYYDLTCKAVYRWSMARAFKASLLKTMSMQAIRECAPPSIERDGGWHFSNFMSADQIANKYQTGGHALPGAVDNVAAHIANRTDLFGRDEVRFTHTPIETNPYLPREIETFQRFFGPQT